MPLFSSVCGAFGGGVKMRFHQGNDAHALNSVFQRCNSSNSKNNISLMVAFMARNSSMACWNSGNAANAIDGAGLGSAATADNSFSIWAYVFPDPNNCWMVRNVLRSVGVYDRCWPGCVSAETNASKRLAQRRNVDGGIVSVSEICLGVSIQAAVSVSGCVGGSYGENRRCGRFYSTKRLYNVSFACKRFCKRLGEIGMFS